MTWKLVSDSFVFNWEVKFLTQTDYTGSVIAELSKCVKISMQISPVSFYRGIFKNKKRPETIFQATPFVEFFDKIFLLSYYTNWPSFITGLCLLSKLFSKIYSSFHAFAFDDVMKFKILKFKNFSNKNEKSFWSEMKKIILHSFKRTFF